MAPAPPTARNHAPYSRTGVARRCARGSGASSRRPPSSWSASTRSRPAYAPGSPATRTVRVGRRAPARERGRKTTPWCGRPRRVQGHILHHSDDLVPRPRRLVAERGGRRVADVPQPDPLSQRVPPLQHALDERLVHHHHGTFVGRVVDQPPGHPPRAHELQVARLDGEVLGAPGVDRLGRDLHSLDLDRPAWRLGARRRGPGSLGFPCPAAAGRGTCAGEARARPRLRRRENEGVVSRRRTPRVALTVEAAPGEQ